MRKPFFRYLKAGLILLCFPGALCAQNDPEVEREEDHSSYIAAHIGVSIPGKFFNKESDYYSPFCGSGNTLAFEGVWLPHRNIGFTLSANYIGLKRGELDRFHVSGHIAGQTSGDWASFLLMGGLYFSKPFASWQLEGKIKTGFGDTRAFEKFYATHNESYEQRVNYNGITNWHQLGITARLDQKPGWSVALNYEYNFSNPEWEIIETYKGSIQGQVRANRPSVVSISVISLSVLYSIPHYVKK